MPQDDVRQKIQNRALTAMLVDAFFTWQSAVTIGFFLVMFFLFPTLFLPWIPFWHNWFWLILGAAAEAIYLGATVTDPVASEQAVSRMLEEQFDPRKIKNLVARQRLQKALEYKKLIDDFVGRQTGALKVSLQTTTADIHNWIQLIYQLAKSIDAFEGNAIIDRDRRSVPTDLADLKRRIAKEDDPGVKAELDEAIQIRQRLVDSLKTIENNAKRTEIKMDNTVAQLSTVYAQMQLVNSRELDSGHTQRLRDEIHGEVDSLSDLISAMSDVYQYKGYAGAVESLNADNAAAKSSANSTASSADTSSTPAARTITSRKN